MLSAEPLHWPHETQREKKFIDKHQGGISKEFARLFDPSCDWQLEIPPGKSNSNGTVDAVS